ncbi:MAG: hypothetical protein ACRBDI_09570 [Alphaproteobacteria bacterium]
MVFKIKTVLFVTLGVVFLSLLVARGSVAVDAPEKDVDDIEFAIGTWDPSLLEIIEAGPRILTRDVVFDVAAPPSNDSEITRLELDNLLAIQEAERSDEEIKRIVFEHTGKKAHQIFEHEGLLNQDNYKTNQLMTMIDVDHSYFILERKKHFARARPNQLDENIKTVLPNPGHAAYPSGHASQLYMVALVLSDFDPENEMIYKQFAYDVTHRREIAGFHYVSDSIAGRKLAVDVLAKLRENLIFEKKYQDAKASYTKPSAEAILKYKDYLAARGEAVPLMPEVAAEWQEIGFKPK